MGKGEKRVGLVLIQLASVQGTSHIVIRSTPDGPIHDSQTWLLVKAQHTWTEDGNEPLERGVLISTVQWYSSLTIGELAFTITTAVFAGKSCCIPV